MIKLECNGAYHILHVLYPFTCISSDSEFLQKYGNLSFEGHRPLLWSCRNVNKLKLFQY